MLLSFCMQLINEENYVRIHFSIQASALKYKNTSKVLKIYIKKIIPNHYYTDDFLYWITAQKSFSVIKIQCLFLSCEISINILREFLTIKVLIQLGKLYWICKGSQTIIGEY